MAVQTLSTHGAADDLLRGVLELAITGDEDVRLDQDDCPMRCWREPNRGRRRSDADELCVLLVHEFRVLAERSAGVWKTYRDAAAVDADVAAAGWR